jgi:hypothetical protein
LKFGSNAIALYSTTFCNMLPVCLR